MGVQDTAFLPTSEKSFPHMSKSLGSEHGLHLRDQSLHPGLQTFLILSISPVAGVPLMWAS